MYRFRRSQRQTYAYGALNGANASPDAGQRQYNPLHTTAQSHRYRVQVEGDINITVAGTGVLNRGSILGALDAIGVNENGVDKVFMDPRILRFIAERAAPSKITATRLATAAVGTTHLVESFDIYMADPYSVTPRETAFLVRDPKQSLRLFHVVNAQANGVGRIVAGATATLSNIKVSVIQVMDEFETARPYFIPIYRQIETPIVAVQPALELNVITSKFLRALVIQQDTDLGEVNDIIANLGLYGDQRQIIGPEMASFDMLARMQESEFGGDVYGGGNGYLYINFQDGGRLTNVWNPSQDNNLRLRFDCKPTAKAGATRSVIRVGLIELDADQSAVTPDGKPLTDKIEFPV